MPCLHGGCPREIATQQQPSSSERRSSLGGHALLAIITPLDTPRAVTGVSPVPVDQLGARWSLLSPWSWHGPVVTLGCIHVLGTFLCQEGSQPLKESLGGGVSTHMSLVVGTQLGWTRAISMPWGAQCGVPSHPQLTPQRGGEPQLFSPCCGRSGAPSLLGARGLSLRGPPAGWWLMSPRWGQDSSQEPGNTARARLLFMQTASTPLASTALPALPPWGCQRLSPHAPSVSPWQWHPGPSPVQPDHRCPSWTAVCWVPSPWQPPSPSTGCLPVTRRLAMGDFSQLRMKS